MSVKIRSASVKIRSASVEHEGAEHKDAKCGV